MQNKASTSLALLLVPVIVGCNHTTDGAVDIELKSSEAVLSAHNPSLDYCTKQGFEIQPVMEDGVVRSHFCINPALKRCDSWAFFRKECSLE